MRHARPRRLGWALAACLACAAAGPVAAASGAITLQVSPGTAAFGATVTYTGAVTPAGVAHVEVRRWNGAAWRLVVEGDSRADGTYRLQAPARAAGQVVARSGGDESDPVDLRVRPSLAAHVEGPALLGARLVLEGRLRPAAAGKLAFTVRGRRRHVALGADGRFRVALPTGRVGRLRVVLSLDPEPGYVGVRRTLHRRIQAPVLGVGSRGPAVRLLERRLRALRYALPRANGTFRSDTLYAVYAFQKVEGLPRDGLVRQRVWRALAHARTPKPQVRRGNHIEVDKSRQVLFEVRKGKVARIVHVSTGATGNTPLGRWRVYRKSPGFNSLGMYYSLYFHLGFAVHGYHSVPPFPASHGCVRIPLWYAHRLYDSWSLGTVVRVFA